MEIFKKNIIRDYGVAGERWCESLSSLLDKCASRFGLSNFRFMPGAAYNYVAVAFCDELEKDVVLKIRPDIKEARQEVLFLWHYQGFGAARLHDFDFELGAFVLEKVGSGVTLKELWPKQDGEAVIQMSEVIMKMQRCDKELVDRSVFPRITDWFEKVDLEKCPKGLQEHARRAKELLPILLRSQPEGEFILLHADLHHENVLYNSEKKEYLFIDPQGAIGPKIYEVGAFVRNPIGFDSREDIAVILRCRILQFGALLGFDFKVLKEWCYIQAVLSCYWSVGQDRFDEYLKTVSALSCLNFEGTCG